MVVDVPDWLDALAQSGAVHAGDEAKMALLIRLAVENVERGMGGPFAAAIFEQDSHRLVAAGVNSVARLRSCILHAEVVAIVRAQARLGAFTLRAEGMPAYELVTSCEPCAMCLGATLYSGVRRLVTGAAREDAMEIGFDEGPVFPESYAYLAERGIAITRGVLRADAARLFRTYRDRGGVIYT
jgi:tRNA(Arg) A34 adenosine deaminase TadA